MTVFNAYIEYDSMSEMYIGLIPNVEGAHTQGKTLDELQKNLQEVLSLCLEEGQYVKTSSRFVGIQQIEV